MIPFYRPSLGKEEIQEVSEVIKSGWIGLGPKTEEFESALEKFLGKKYITSTNSATSALHLALIMSGVSESDEVISPALTFVSTNHVILYQKATPVFCDVDPETLCADPKDIIKKITKKTKAIIVVHYGGHAVDMDPIIKVAKEKNIKVIEDAAHAFGGKYKGKMLGTIGDYGCYSFHAVKNIAMADGGAIFTKKKIEAKKLKELRWMGINKDTWHRTGSKKYSWYYDVTGVGYKYHPNDVLSALGVAQLKKFKSVLARKRELYDNYLRGLKDVSWIKLPYERNYEKNALHNFCIQVPQRDKLSEYLLKNGIGTSVHYIPNNHYKIYKKYKSEIPVTEKVWKKILLLPFFPQLTDKEQMYIIDTIKLFK
ncbi:MAG: DegT/DnrJ/EryC1/StrS family aminotransferase [Candidatus Levyibacteriota bacterium]